MPADPKSEAATQAVGGDYRPKIVTELTYDGATITWKHTPAGDRAKFAQTIRGYVADLRDTYQIKHDLGGSGDLMLQLSFKGPSSATDRQIMKGTVFMIEGDTIWGGGGS
jgi:hypothetical protein